jgi:histidyl-tRNA synthetase
MAKTPKHWRPKARLPRGFADRTAGDIRAADRMMAAIREVFELYGFDPVETPAFEYTDALGKFLPDQDRPGEGVFSLLDDDEQWLSLRYDLTAPLARHVAENINTIGLPYRTYRAGYVFRNEKPGPGRFRQFMQFDADTVGAPGVTADAEMCMMMADTMEALGIARGDYVVRVNNRKVLDGVMEAIGVTEEHQRLAVLRHIDKLDKFGREGVRLLLGEGRKDESGDFTMGAGLSDKQITRILFFLTVRTGSAVRLGDYRGTNLQDEQITGSLVDSSSLVDSNEELLERWDQEFLVSTTPGHGMMGLEGIAELGQIAKLCSAAGYGTRRIRIHPSVVRGLEYYTGPVYECELLFPVTNDKGETVQFGSVAGGGRYDGLIERFTGQKVPATGFSIGVSRLATALKNLGKLDADAVLAPVVVCIMDRDAESLGRYQEMVQLLRKNKIRAELFQGNPKNFGNQLKYADRRGSPLAIIQGADERAKGEVQIKDLALGTRLARTIDSREAWTEARAAQFSVPEADLVAAVRKALAEG